MSDINIIIDDLKYKFNHQFVYDIYEHCKNYKICGLCCLKCKFKIYIYMGINNYIFEKQLRFKYIININGLEYAYDTIMLTCDEEIIRSIIE